MSSASDVDVGCDAFSTCTLPFLKTIVVATVPVSVRIPWIRMVVDDANFGENNRIPELWGSVAVLKILLNQRREGVHE